MTACPGVSNLYGDYTVPLGECPMRLLMLSWVATYCHGTIGDAVNEDSLRIKNISSVVDITFSDTIRSVHDR